MAVYIVPGTLKDDFDLSRNDRVKDNITGKFYSKIWFKVCYDKIRVIYDFGQKINRSILLEMLNSSDIPFSVRDISEIDNHSLIRVDNISNKYIYRGN